METSLEKELREWRENRTRSHAAVVAQRHRSVPSFSSSSANRRVLVNGQEVVVVNKARRTLA